MVPEAKRSAGGSQAVGAKKNEALGVLEAERDRALSKYHLGEYGAAAEILGEEVKAGVDEFQEALKPMSSDPLIHKAQGETFEKRGRFEEAAKAYQDAARAMAAAQRFDQAIAMLDRALSLKRDDPTALLFEKEAFLSELNRHGETLEVLDHAWSSELEHDAFALSARGRLLCALNRSKEAVEMLRSVVKLKPEATWAHTELGEVLHSAGEYDEALEVLDKALDREPDYAPALKTKRRVLRDLNRNEEAVTALRHAVQLNPNVVWAHKELGEALRAAGEHEEALQELDRALVLDPGNTRILGSKGETLRELGRYEEALRELDRALSLDPDYTWALATRGETLRELDRYEEALQSLDQALALRPDYTFALGTKGAVLHALSRYEEALQALDRALDLDADYVFALGAKGQVLCDAAYYRLVFEVLEQAKPHGSFETWIFALRGWAHEKLGSSCQQEAQLAKQAYEDALGTDPDHPWLHKALGNALYLLGDEKGADNAYRRTIERASELAREGYAPALALTGWCHYRLKDHKKAVRFFNNALSFDPDLVSAQFDLALTLMCWRQYGDARSEYESALRLARSKHALPRRGWVDVARQDLKLAEKKQRELKKVNEVGEVLGKLNDAFVQATAITAPIIGRYEQHQS